MADVSLSTGGLTVGTGPSLDTVPTFSLPHKLLSATGVTVAVPTLSLGNLNGNVDELTAADLTPYAPALDAVPGMSTQAPETLVSFSVDDVVAVPTVAQPTLDTVDAGEIILTASNLTVAHAVLGTPVYQRSRLLGTPPALTVAHAVLGTPTFNQNRHLTGTGPSLPAPTLGTPVIHQKHVLTGTPFVDAAPGLGTPVEIVHRTLTASNLTVAVPVLATPAAIIKRPLPSQDLMVATPWFGTATFNVGKNFTAPNLLVSTLGVDNGVFGQNHKLTGTTLTVATPTLGTPSTAPATIFIGTALTVAAPALTTPALGQNHHIAGSMLATGVPVPGEPLLQQNHHLAAASLTVGAPVLGQPSWVAGLLLSAANLTVATPQIAERRPVLGFSAVIDIVLLERISPSGTVFDILLQNNDVISDQQELATAARVALGTDRLADADEILPDPESTDRRGWWADTDAEEIWGGWPIGTRNWLLTRSKITTTPSSEGDTVERARRYTYEALQPFVDKRIASALEVDARRVGLERIEVKATLFRGPLPEVELRFQALWDGIQG